MIWLGNWELTSREFFTLFVDRDNDIWMYSPLGIWVYNPEQEKVAVLADKYYQASVS